MFPGSHFTGFLRNLQRFFCIFIAMSFFSDIYQRLFRNTPQTGSYRKPFLQETLKRSSTEIRDYEALKDSSEMRRLFDDLYDNYLREINDRENPLGLYILDSKAASGFYFRIVPPFTAGNIYFFFDALRDKILQEDYHLYTSHRKVYLKNGKTEITEMHYLKPPVSAEMVFPQDQMYGNIQIDLVSIEGEPQYIKLMASVYSDRNYSEPRDFSLLMEKLCVY